MTFQAYLDTVKAKTGLEPADFRRLAAEKGLTKHGEIIAWLKGDYGLGHGHANAVAAVLLKSEAMKASPEDKLARLFSGKKARWRGATDRLIAAVEGFGPDVTTSPNATYVNLNRGKAKFGVIQPGSAGRLDVGIKRRGVATEGRFEAADTWNPMVTHRVQVTDDAQVDAELMAWLRAAYDGAG